MLNIFLNKFNISKTRLSAIMNKEFRQMLRDPATSGLMVGTPIIQLVLFGYAINMTPKNLPTIIINNDKGYFSRKFLSKAQSTGYFSFLPKNYNELEANNELIKGNAEFIINIPASFSKDIVRHNNPIILVDADATDPTASSSALAALETITNTAYVEEALGPLQLGYNNKPVTTLQMHLHYNPTSSTKYNIIPGLTGVILTMTLVMVTSMALAREVESGTHEFLLATPATAIEVILGKMTPYLFVGYIQILVIILLGHFVMGVPIVGDIFILLFATLPFILANLSVGLIISTIAKTQIQASVGSIFFFLPSLMLSGFFFPFRGMPEWAQIIGNLLPLSHYLVIVRGVMLKGANFIQILSPLLAISAFTIVAITIAISKYRGTLD